MIIHNLNVIPNLRNGRLPLNSNINTVSGSSGGGGGGSVSPETIISLVKPYLDLKLDISTYALDISTLSALINTKAPIDSPNFTGTPTINNNVIYHAGNANLSTVDWAARNLTASGIVSGYGIKTIASDYPQIQFVNSSDNITRLLFTHTNTNKLLYRYNGVNDGEVYHSYNSNLPTVDWSAKILNASNTINASSNITSGATVQGNKVISKNTFKSEARNIAAITGSWGASNYWGLGEDTTQGYVRLLGCDENGTFNTQRVNLRVSGNLIANTDKQVWDAGNSNLSTVDWSAKILNASNTINASSNITSGATIQGNKVISRGVVKSEGRGVAGYVGNWGGSSYYGLGEDTTASWIKLSGCDADGIWNSTPVNLKISGSTQIGQTLQSSSYSGTGFSASGWGVDSDGNMNIKSLTVRELARFYELEIAKIRAVNGGLAVTPADGKITSIDSSNNKLYFKDADSLGFVVGDIVRAQKWDGGVRGFKAPVVAIDTVNKSITLGTFIIGDFSQIKVGDDVIVWDSTVAGRDGLIYMSANDSGSPFVDIIKKQATKLRIGNIGNMSWNGTNIPENTIGYWANGDVYINNGYFSGQVQVTGGNIYNKTAIDSSLSTINTNVTNVSTNAATAKTIATDASTKATTAISTVTDLSTNYNTWKPTIKAMAYQDMVEFAKLGTTIIQGGYIKASLIDAATIVVNGGGVNKTYVDGSLGTVNTNITNLNSSVNTATNTANTANSTANTANTNANTAISTANTAKSGVDSLNTWKTTIGTLAYQNAVSAAMCDTTLISGGYIKTSLLNANEIFAKQATIGGWNLVADSIDSTNGRMRIHNGVTSVFVSKPSGGHVMLGQTYINGAWTGQYGISATNAYSQELFRLDDSGNRIAGWNFDSYQIYQGTNGVGLEPMIRLSTQNAGDGYIYGGSRVLEGLSLTWHRSNNAGHIVFGQLAANGTTLKDGFKGIQMMDWRGYEYFALGANVNVENPDSHYCRIAGWAFNNQAIYSNNIEINANGYIRHNADKWRFNSDGSWQLAGGKLYGNAAGDITGQDCTFNNGTFNNGTFNGSVTADRGKIGGFSIIDNNMSCTTTDKTLILNGNKGTISISGAGQFDKGYVNIGFSSATSASNKQIIYAARFDSPQDYTSDNIYTSIYAKSYQNAAFAVYGEGYIVCNKSVVGKGVNFLNFYTGIPKITLTIQSGTTYVVTNNSNTDRCYIEMPLLADIRNYLGIGLGESFVFPIKIIGRYNTPRLFYVGTNNGEYRTYDNNGGFSDIKMSGGDSLDVVIISDGTTTWGQWVNYLTS